MYGSETLNHHNILLYGLTKEFMESFSSLTYCGIELPLPLLRNYHLYISAVVEENLKNHALVGELQERHGFYSFKDVQDALERRPPVKRDLSVEKGRNMLAVYTRQAQFLPFVLDRFPDAAVLVILWSSREKAYFPDCKLPSSYRVFPISDQLAAAQPDRNTITRILHEADLLLNEYGGHMIFGQPVFRPWLRKVLLISIRVIHVMKRIFQEHPVRVVLSNGEVGNPGLTLSLLAAQYNLPFINALTSLITDRNLIPTRAAYYCVWGDHYRNWLQKRGIDDSKILLTGNVRFQYDRRDSNYSRKQLLSMFNIPENNLVFMFATQPFPGTVNHAVAGWIRQGAAGRPVTVLIRRHPNDSLDYSAFLEKGRIVVTPETLELYDLMPHINYMMTISSDTAIEAALLQKGIIVFQPKLPYHFNLNSNDFHSFLVRSRAGFTVSSVHDMCDVFNTLCNDKAVRGKLLAMGQKFLEKTVHKGGISTPGDDIYRFIKAMLP